MVGVTELLGPAIRRVRRRRGWSQQAVIDRMTTLYAPDPPPLSRDKFAKIENGSRRAGLEDWVAISAALNVPPLLLLVPQDDADTVEVAGSSLHPGLALRWFMGEHALPGGDRVLIRQREWWTEAEALRLYEAKDMAETQLRRAKERVTYGEHANEDDTAMREHRAAYAKALGEYVRTLSMIDDAGLVRPEDTPEFRDEVRTVRQMMRDEHGGTR
jgi:transcriptional regulator with XRE-family HTH domain